MKLLDYVGHTVRVKTKDGSTFMGFVENYHDSKDSMTGREELIIGTRITVLPINEIENIDFAENREINKINLVAAENIARELNVSIETIKDELTKIDHIINIKKYVNTRPFILKTSEKEYMLIINGGVTGAKK